MTALGALVAVLVALIAGAATVLSNRKTRTQNQDQHGAVERALGHLAGKVDGMTGELVGTREDVRHLAGRVDDHLADHARRTAGDVRTRATD